MVNINSSTQLSVFDLIKAALIANSTLSSKFNSNNIFQYEPKHKGIGTVSFPYIWVSVPELSDEHVVFNNNVTLKDLSASLVLRMEYQAKDNLLSYANAIVEAVEAYESTFQASGYYDVKCEVQGVNSDTVIDQKELVEADFMISFKGQVSR